MTRRVYVQCFDAVGATVASGPAHGQVSDVKTDSSRVSFTLDTDSDSPRHDELTLTVQGHNSPIDLHVAIEVIPREENQPPHCDGDKVSQRSDGKGPVDVYTHPSCSDPEGDPFVVEGGGPGTHASSPEKVPAGDGMNNWPYRTAAFDGHERAPIWATDELGARSQDAYLDVTVGPSLDSPATCQPNPGGWTPDGVGLIRMRPDAVSRRFAIICTDPDGDTFVPQVTSAPTHGALAAFDLGTPMVGWWGLEQWIDATYVPADNSPRDPFDLTTVGTRGEPTLSHFAMVKVPDGDNWGAGCGWSPAQITRNVPGTVSFSCEDDDGDPLTATVVGEPHHGTVTDPVLTPTKFGGETISVPYVPAPGWTGVDCIQVAIDDGHGYHYVVKVDVVVNDAPVAVPPLPVDPVGAVGAVSPPVPVGGTPSQSVLQQALGTVLRVGRVKPVPAGLDVWAPPRLSRRELLRKGRAAGLLVRCASRCSITSETQLKFAGARGRATRSARHTTMVRTAGRQSQVLWVTLDGAQRRALKRARSGQAVFRLRVQVGRARARVVQRVVRIG
jgi:hypothetical protein